MYMVVREGKPPRLFATFNDAWSGWDEEMIATPVGYKIGLVNIDSDVMLAEYTGLPDGGDHEDRAGRKLGAYGGGAVPWQVIAKELGISHQRAMQLAQQGLRKARGALAKAGYTVLDMMWDDRPDEHMLGLTDEQKRGLVV
jgi:hypothetical protein